MELTIQIEQIDNGFILGLFDGEGPPEHDETVYFKDFDAALTRIREWKNEIEEINKQEKCEDEQKAST